MILLKRILIAAIISLMILNVACFKALAQMVATVPSLAPSPSSTLVPGHGKSFGEAFRIEWNRFWTDNRIDILINDVIIAGAAALILFRIAVCRAKGKQKKQLFTEYRPLLDLLDSPSEKDTKQIIDEFVDKYDSIAFNANKLLLTTKYRFDANDALLCALRNWNYDQSASKSRENLKALVTNVVEHMSNEIKNTYDDLK